MSFFNSDNHNEVYNGQPHEAKWSHELVGGAAAFAAVHEYQKHQEANGKPENHKVAKELLAAFAGAEADKLFETHGLNFLDRQRVKREAEQQAVDNLNY